MSYDDMPQKQARIEALREEKGRLQKVRQTIAFYEANAASGKVKKAVLPQMAQQIQPAEGAKYSHPTVQEKLLTLGTYEMDFGRWQHSVGFTSVSELDHGCGI